MLLATRSGFNDADYARDYLGQIGGGFAIESGRATTPLVDTATQDWVLRPFDVAWTSLRRQQDYYDEGMLIWIGVDAIIREKTRDKKSLDDFLREFFGQRDTEPIVVPYTREDVEKTLSAVCAYDWHNYFETRIYKVNSKPPTDGLEAAGWRLVYNATPNNDTFFSDLLPFSYDGTYSIGLSVKKDGTIFDVLQGMPAWDAELGPNMVVLAVDGRAYSGDVLNQSIAHPWNGKIVLQVRNFNSVETHEIRYAGGVRYPHLERIPGTQDYLTEMLEARSYKEH
jgi:predicted metalloprotease with PDZ domain